MDNAYSFPVSDDGQNTAVNPQERRRESIFLGAQIVFEGAASAVSVRVRNISTGGMMIDSGAKHAKGKMISATIKGIGEVCGHVAWATDTRIGIAFDAPIDPKLARQQITNETPPPGYNKPYIYDRRPGLAVR
jgi:PilZ domain